MILFKIICFKFPCVAGSRMTDPKHEELVLDGIASIPNPHSNKTCSCKSSTRRFTLSNSCHWFSLMRVFQFNRQFLWEKRCFEKQCVRFLVCLPKRGLHLGKTYFFKQIFCSVLRSWYCSRLKVLRVHHLEKIFCCCLLAFCQLRELLRQNLCRNCCMSASSGFNFHVCHTSFIQIFSISHSRFPGWVPSVERLWGSVSLIFGLWTFTEWHRQRLCKLLRCGIITKCQTL